LEQFCVKRFDSREHYCKQFFVDHVAKTCEERGMREERGGTKKEREKEGRERRKNKKKEGEEGGVVNSELILHF
jgi:ribosome assembly protein YihI (activator of Der GTPase)